MGIHLLEEGTFLIPLLHPRVSTLELSSSSAAAFPIIGAATSSPATAHNNPGALPSIHSHGILLTSRVDYLLPLLLLLLGSSTPPLNYCCSAVGVEIRYGLGLIRSFNGWCGPICSPKIQILVTYCSSIG
ncbi:hypothetical protein U9M48_011155 [Paspalum notatum var. saurae]|uniref:Uncharacterized protein n=1 Tax=Paspalum notatum var. saurae TaxID=547442 RepID=A0AAQ3SVL5_PASNO